MQEVSAELATGEEKHAQHGVLFAPVPQITSIANSPV
jgi:hypothetical protein